MHPASHVCVFLVLFYRIHVLQYLDDPIHPYCVSLSKCTKKLQIQAMCALRVDMFNRAISHKYVYAVYLLDPKAPLARTPMAMRVNFLLSLPLNLPSLLSQSDFAAIL